MKNILLLIFVITYNSNNSDLTSADVFLTFYHGVLIVAWSYTYNYMVTVYKDS